MTKRRSRPDPSARFFFLATKVAGLPAPVREWRFHETRLWRFDFAWPEQKIAVEIDGGNWIQGGHNTGAGRDCDNEKQNAAVVLGWRLLRYTASSLRSESQVLEDLCALFGRSLNRR